MIVNSKSIAKEKELKSDLSKHYQYTLLRNKDVSTISEFNQRLVIDIEANQT